MGDKDALAAFHLLSELEGIIPALESAHAVACAVEVARTMPKGSSVIVNLSGRGDKDVAQVAEMEGSSMSRIAGTFERLAKESSGAYIPYVCAGDPDAEFTVSLATRLLDSGADILELGIPFSDPVADGPVIQGAMNRSLGGGFKVARVFDVVGAIRSKGYDQPIVLMTYSNPVLRMGVQSFCSRASKAGADAVLMVDMPPEESRELDRERRNVASTSSGWSHPRRPTSACVSSHPGAQASSTRSPPRG